MSSSSRVRPGFVGFVVVVGRVAGGFEVVGAAAGREGTTPERRMADSLGAADGLGAADAAAVAGTSAGDADAEAEAEADGRGTLLATPLAAVSLG
jgi:hypothetical protein